MWGPPVISWFISPSNKYHKKIVIGVINQLSYLGGLTLYIYIYNMMLNH